MTMPALNGEAEGQLFYGKPLVFRAKAHRYFWGGEDIPSVTTILGNTIPKQALIQWAANMAVDHILREVQDTAGVPWETFKTVCEDARKAHTVKKETAADLGSVVHDYAQSCLSMRQLLPLPEDASTHPACEAFREWYRGHQINAFSTERMLVSAKMGYAGRCDFFGTIDNALGVLDFKTSAGIYNEFWIQLAAYEVALVEELQLQQPLKRWLLHLDKKTGKFSFKEREQSPIDLQAWAACVMLDKMLRLMKKMET